MSEIAISIGNIVAISEHAQKSPQYKNKSWRFLTYLDNRKI